MQNILLNNDVKMPILGLGTWLSEPGEVYQAVRWAIKLGYKHIDCASIYGNQKEIGQALHDAIAEKDIKREELFVTSKLWNDCHAPQDVEPALRQTLQDLQLDYLDLYLIHWPVAQVKGVLMPQKDEDWIELEKLPLEETWAEMEKLYENGLVRAIGVSNFNEKKLEDLMKKSKIVPMVNQIECHPFLQQSELIDFAKKNNIAITAYSPLGAKPRDKGEHLLENEEIVGLANKLNATPAQIVLAWQMQRGVIVIPKSVHENRIRENFAAQVVMLDDADVEVIERLDKGYRFITGDSFVNLNKGYSAIF